MPLVNAAPPYEIRVLGAGDARLLRALLDCLGEAFEDPTTYCSAQPDDAYLNDLLDDGSFVAIVAMDGERVVGGLAGYELRKFEQARSEFYIYDLGVLELYRRRGIATALIEASRRVAKAKGAWVVYVQADLVDAPAIELYTKLGSREDVLHFDIPVD